MATSYICHFLSICIHTCVLETLLYVNLDFKGKQDNKPKSPLFYLHRKKAAQVGFESTISCYQGIHSTNCMHELCVCACVCVCVWFIIFGTFQHNIDIFTA